MSDEYLKLDTLRDYVFFGALTKESAAFIYISQMIKYWESKDKNYNESLTKIANKFNCDKSHLHRYLNNSVVKRAGNLGERRRNWEFVDISEESKSKQPESSMAQVATYDMAQVATPTIVKSTESKEYIYELTVLISRREDEYTRKLIIFNLLLLNTFNTQYSITDDISSQSLNGSSIRPTPPVAPPPPPKAEPSQLATTDYPIYRINKNGKKQFIGDNLMINLFVYLKKELDKKTVTLCHAEGQSAYKLLKLNNCFPDEAVMLRLLKQYTYFKKGTNYYFGRTLAQFIVDEINKKDDKYEDELVI